MSSFLRRAAVFSLLLLQACLALPLNTPRDAALLPPGETRQAAMLVSPALYTSTSFQPTIFGSGSSAEYMYRRGTTVGAERAFRVGISGFPLLPGLYGGVETARDLRRGTRAWGTVGYAGALAGVEGWTATFLPLHKYAQAYAGMVVGKVRGGFRPELNLRATLQPGYKVWAPYLASVATVEPRLRLRARQVDFVFGLGLDAGYLACHDCAFNDDGGGRFVYGVHPMIGAALP